jgi:hypothetical protein
MNDEVVKTSIEQCHVIMDGVNNLSKKRVSCRYDPLAKNFWAKNIGDVEIRVIQLRTCIMKNYMVK